MRPFVILAAVILMSVSISAQSPSIEPGVPLELAQWRAKHYSNIRYGLDIRLEKGAKRLKGTIKIEVDVRRGTGEADVPIVLDWRKLAGNEQLSTLSYVRLNGRNARYVASNQHLIFRKGVKEGRNEITLNFTSPILTSGAAVTRYVDKEDGSEYIYSLFVPSDASTAFPVFDQPDLKARFKLEVTRDPGWRVISNTSITGGVPNRSPEDDGRIIKDIFAETEPISTYVFAFAAGPFTEITEGGKAHEVDNSFTFTFGSPSKNDSAKTPIRLFVRKSQAKKLLGPPQAADAGKAARAPVGNGPTDAGEPVAKRLTADRSPLTSAEEVIRLNREAINYFESYFDFPFPFPKYDIVLIPEFPFGGMEHAGETFLRETSVIFPTEPTANNYISRASTMFHEAAHQWFGDTVTMKWFDDLWLKEGFATFMAYKAMEHILPEYNAWKVFYQRVKPAAYATDVTKGTVPIYQDIPNLNSAKSAYGNIVYQKAPSFLRQAEFFLGEDKFREAVRNFLRDHAYSNATWSDLVGSFEKASGKDLKTWANAWVKKRSLPIVRLEKNDLRVYPKPGQPHDTALIYSLLEQDALGEGGKWPLATEILQRFASGRQVVSEYTLDDGGKPDKNGFASYWTYLSSNPDFKPDLPVFVYPNYRDYGYGIFLLDPKSREYTLKNIRTEKDNFLRAQMWGSLWDSVRFAELAPLDYINLAIANIDIESDDTTISSILGRTAYAYTYYLSDKQQDGVAPKLEALLIDKMYNAPNVGQRITYYRALLGVAKGEKAREALKELFLQGVRRQETGDREGKSEISTRSGSDGQDIGQESEDRRQETGHGESDMGVPRRGARSVAPGGAEGGTRGEGPNLIAEPRSGDIDAGRDARGPAALSSQHSSLSTSADPPFTIRPKDRFDIATRLIEIGDPDGAKFLAELEKTEKDDAALRWAYAAKAAFATKENKAKFWRDFTENKEISESWIEAAAGTWNSPSQADLTLPYLAKALALLPELKRDRKIFFVNNWLGAFIRGQKSAEALDIVTRFLDDNPKMDVDLRRKILENVDGLERAVKIRAKFGH